MSQPKLLDLFCGAGGAAMGYHRAGFDVVGVDIKPQPRYPFSFIEGDALEYLAAHGSEYDAIHASPPCQGYTTMGNRYRGKGGPEHARLIATTRDMLAANGCPYVIENVEGAASEMRSPVRIHGGMFSLGVFRPRLFESNLPLLTPARTPRPHNAIGVYGKLDGRRIWTRKDGTEQRAARTLGQASAAMGIQWMEWDELKEAIPPAYTEYLGHQLMKVVLARLAA